MTATTEDTETTEDEAWSDDDYVAYLFESEAERHLATARAQDALARKLDAEAEKLEAERDTQREHSRVARIMADAEARKEKIALARDENHHRYAFNTEVSSTTVAACMSKLTEWSRNDPGCDIEIVFTSPGGSIIAGMALFDYLQQLRRDGHHLTTHTLGLAASMAGILLQSGSTRVMGKEAWLLIHEASFGAGGKIGEVEDTVEWVKKVGNRILDIFSERCKCSRSYIKTHWTRKDWWVSSDEALKLGFVDEVR